MIVSQSEFERHSGTQMVCEPAVVQVVGLFEPAITSVQQASVADVHAVNAPMVQLALGHHCGIAQTLTPVDVATQHPLAQPAPVVHDAEQNVPAPGIVTQTPAVCEAASMQHVLPVAQASPMGMHAGGTTQCPSTLHG